MPASPSFALTGSAMPLVVNPGEQAPAGLTVAVSLADVISGPAPGWHLRYTVTGDADALAIPAPASPGPADGLWRHTCLEAFVQDGDGPGYHEFNFAPSGQWAVYRFRAERERATADSPPTTGPSITLERSPGSFILNAWVPHSLLPVRPTAIGLSAVIETRNGEVSHWALHHPRADRPDFHHPAGWTHRLDLSSFPNATPSA
jgi:hypothetical protein